VNIDDYRRRLLELERELVSRLEREKTTVRGAAEQTMTDVGDIGDASVADEMRDEQLAEAEIDWTLLTQVREALQRIDAGTFGRCVVDGEPIDEKRLQALPWTPYCLEHQESLEAAAPPKSLTL
jgi:DnaK suppressor protein